MKLMIKSFWNLFVSNSDEKGLDLKKASAWNPLGRLPRWISSLESPGDHTKVKKANRYLKYMERRLKILHINGEYNKIVILWVNLLKVSKVYQMTLFHRTYSEWYWKISEGDAIRTLKSFMNQIRKQDLTLELKRYYLDKGLEKCGIPNGRMRPIGSPTLPSRMISKALNDLIYFVFEDKLASYQHAYRKERGTHTALLEIWLRITNLKQRNIYEFDFKSYFNSVKVDWVIAYLRRRSTGLADLINTVIFQIKYTFDRDIRLLPEEAEFRLISPKYWTQKPKMVRKGLPQGLSISPILATMVLDSLPPMEGLVMYADDGVILSDKDDEKKILKWFEDLKIFGLNIEPVKSGKILDKFKFVGVTFDLKEESVTYNESIYSWKNKDVSDVETLYEVWTWFRTVAQYYGKKSVGWTWEIHNKAAILEFKGTKGNWWTWLRIIWNGLWKAESYKGERYFVGKGIFNISSSSTKCCSQMMEKLKDFRLVKIRKTSWIGNSWQKYLYTNRGKYWERSNRVTALMDLMVATGAPGKGAFQMIKPVEKKVPEKKITIRRIPTVRYKYGRKLRN